MAYNHNNDYDQEEADAKLARKINQEEADAELARKLVEQDMINGQNAACAPYNDNATTSSNNGTRVSIPSATTESNNNGTQQQPDVVANCPGSHGLTQFIASHAQRVRCDQCHQRLDENEEVYSCIICNYDTCASCYRNPSSIRPARSNATPSSSSQVPSRQQRRGTNAVPFPIPSSYEPPTHMCLVPCEVGKGICVEMLVDTGAQSSVISYSLAQRLNLTNRLDRSHQGVAAGVGTARIMGKLRNIAVVMGHNVEFIMDFIVLDVKDQQLLLLGLDQMRKYKCIVDLQRDMLIFGGIGGVEVSLLPADQSHVNIRNSLGQLGCPMM